MIKRFSTYINESDDNQEKEEIITTNSVKGNNLKERDNEVNENNAIPQNPPEPKTFKYCILCNQKLFSIKGRTIHLQSKKHIKRLKRVTFDEIHSAGSIKKYLINKKIIKGLKRSPVSRARYQLYSHLLRKMYKRLPIN